MTEVESVIDGSNLKEGVPTLGHVRGRGPTIAKR